MIETIFLIVSVICSLFFLFFAILTAKKVKHRLAEFQTEFDKIAKDNSYLKEVLKVRTTRNHKRLDNFRRRLEVTGIFRKEAQLKANALEDALEGVPPISWHEAIAKFNYETQAL